MLLHFERRSVCLSKSIVLVYGMLVHDSQVCMHAYILTSLHPHVHTCLHVCILTSRCSNDSHMCCRVCMFACLLQRTLNDSRNACAAMSGELRSAKDSLATVFTFMHTCSHLDILTRLHARILTCPNRCMPVRLHAYVPACLHAA